MTVADAIQVVPSAEDVEWPSMDALRKAQSAARVRPSCVALDSEDHLWKRGT